MKKWDIFNKLNEEVRKRALTELSLDVIGKYFPRIARVNLDTAQAEFIKDAENIVGGIFVPHDWEQFKKEFLQNVYVDDQEKCKTFFSLENMRRIYGSKEDSSTCTYRRIYEGEFLWMQAVIIPVRREQLENSILIYAKMMDESVKAEEMYKEQLWRQVQQERKEGREKDEFIKYLANNLRNPIDAVGDMSKLAMEALAVNDVKQVEECLHIIERLNVYFSSMLGDLMQVGVMRNKKVTSRKMNISPKTIIDGVKVYYENEEAGIKVQINKDEKLKDIYHIDQSRLIQTLNSLLAPLYEYGENNGDILVQVDVVDRRENCDIISVKARRERGPQTEDFLEEIWAGFPEIDDDTIQTPAMIAMQTLEGMVRVDRTIPANNFELTFVAEYAKESAEKEN